LEYARRPHGEQDANTVISLLERRSQTELARSNFDAAISDLEQLLTLYQERGQRTREGETRFQIGFAHYWAHRLTQASAYLDQALAIADAIDYPELRARALRLRDILHATQGGIASSTGSTAASATDQPPVLDADELWGYAMLAHLRDDAELALRHAQACISVGNTTANTFLILGGSFVLGMAQANLGEYQAALGSLLGALQLAETTSDRFWRARLLNTLGWVYQDLFSLGLALQYDQASLDLARASTPRLTEAEGYALVNLATTQLLLGRSDQARAALDAGLALAEHETFMRWRYFTRLIVIQGQLALMDGDLSDAGELADKALELGRSTKSGKNSARACLLRGQVLLAMDRIDQARSSIQEALSLAQHLHWLGMTWVCQLALADVEQTDHQLQAARIHRRAAQAIIGQITDQLTDPALREQWLDAAAVRKAFAL
jgi:tetratricopeptide (TPR) repeat protein